MQKCDKCWHGPHEPGACGENVGTGYLGPVFCQCGTRDLRTWREGLADPAERARMFDAVASARGKQDED